MKSPLSQADLERLELLFDQAADLPAAERQAFAQRTCASVPALYEQLLHLLRGMEGEDILGQLRPRVHSLIGTQLDGYEVLSLVGEGGMGEVYEAQQQEPVKRRVAIKVIKPGMDSSQVIARFKAERRALALMEHANISRILDGGATPDGRPYFVMEFVSGMPLTEHCDRRKLSTRARLKLFLAICDGVQHAHQKGIIHRDLKPSNLMVMEQDGKPIPKIIDFGVARAISSPLTGHSLQTTLGQVVGTLDYMSPEQADPSAVDVDTRSDIYSLGVVLYELLSGLLPFGRQLGGTQPLSETQRVLREEDPPTPSTRLRRMTGTAATMAPLRGTHERALLQQLSGDLDWICLKALEKNPARRYASASEFAADVRRHLDNLPVLAARPTFAYVASKFVRRHRLALGACTLVIASALTAWAEVTAAAESDRVAKLETARREQLSSLQEVGELESEADRLWPAYPHRIDDLGDWIQRAQDLLSPLSEYRRELSSMRARALPYTDEAGRRDRASHPRAGELAELLKAQELMSTAGSQGVPGEKLQKSIDALKERLAADVAVIELQFESERSWSFISTQDQVWHDRLTRLVRALESMESTFLELGSGTPEHGWTVPDRLERAKRLAEDFARGGAYDLLWQESLPAINVCYPGLELVAQMGLVPIGLNSETGLWEFADVVCGAAPEFDEQGALIRKPESGIVFVLLRGGSYVMGSTAVALTNTGRADGNVRPENDLDETADRLKETPAHRLEVEPFFLSKYELTDAQLRRVLPGRAGAEGGALMPAQDVDWYAGERFALHTGLVLPHEEQWEYAARGGQSSIWSTGNDELSLQGFANLFDQSSAKRFRAEAQEKIPAQIDDASPWILATGTLKPNEFGLHDVHGNVAEWCANLPYSYRPGKIIFVDQRVCRGGSNRMGSWVARCAARLVGSASMSGPALGLRPGRLIHR